MLANSMHAGAAQTMRACGRTLPAARSLTASSAASRALLARRSFSIASSYKARVAVRGYATATATATKKATPTNTTKPRVAAAAGAKKPAAKKAPVKAKALAKPKKAVAKPKKKKVVAKKAVPKKRVKKELTEEKKLVLLRSSLKKTALAGQEPKKLPSIPWQVYLAQNMAGTITGANPVERRVNFAASISRLSADFKNLSASEKSRVDQIAQDNSAVNDANYKKWVLSHTVEEIHNANNARAHLARKFPNRKAGHKIVDDRQPKRPTTAFAAFIKARTTGASGFTPLNELGAVWKSLTDSDKKPYIDLMEAEKVRYYKEYKASGLPELRGHAST